MYPKTKREAVERLIEKVEAVVRKSQELARMMRANVIYYKEGINGILQTIHDWEA